MTRSVPSRRHCPTDLFGFPINPSRRRGALPKES
jgi:hypothetical protein